MDFSQLKHFVCIAQLGGFSKAERALDISQPSLSRQIRLLEEDLNTKLFLRTGRGVALTPTGEAFLPHAQAILEAIASGREALRSASSDLTGKISVGLVPRLARVLTPPLVKAFRTRFPNATISIIENKTPMLVTALNQGHVEVAVLFNLEELDDLVVEPLTEEHYVLIGLRAGGQELPPAIPFEELARFPLILPSLSNSIRANLELTRRRTNTPLNVVVEADTMLAVFDLIRLGIGYSVVGHGEAKLAQSSKEFTSARIAGMGSRNISYLARSRRLPSTYLGEAVAELIRELNLAALIGADPVQPDNGSHG
ncbi:LysR family transcriptional regulator [Ottowia thiooxydans]|uniref:LysR family transcriptional regulator n=1 Tax=Ottowia thiooxydans TaxID=219182 RepID=UPI0004138E1A|nr:LysR family transcriptional regulator [Ottowia thiooxydans]